jgi:NAD(P)-dependent dehydrogenase (short-subunit alcohol dehydrogenase family)
MPRTQLAPRAFITGGASGIGREAAILIARAGSHIIVADRDAVGGAATVHRIVESGGSAEFCELDLGDLSRIRQVVDDEVKRGYTLDVLINNAGLLPPMKRSVTRDGFELEFGIAHLGHFALTGLLLPALLRSKSPRVVSVSSIAHAGGRIDFEDLQLERNYTSSRAYSSTKLACLMFALELQRRSQSVGSPLISVAAHPGVSTTPIASGWKREDRRKLRDRFELFAYSALTRMFGQTAEQGASSLLYAAYAPDVVGGGFYGPTGFKQMNGAPGAVKPAAHALDADVAARLWTESERLTGIRFEALSPSPVYATSGYAENRTG